jgi:hypothetical protein
MLRSMRVAIDVVHVAKTAKSIGVERLVGKGALEIEAGEVEAAAELGDRVDGEGHGHCSDRRRNLDDVRATPSAGRADR